MALDFPNPAGQTPANTFSPTSTPSASTNGVTYVWDTEKWVAADAATFLPIGGGELTGDLTVPSLNGGPLAGFRNQLINGDFSVAQRGNDISLGPQANQYALDRWVSNGDTRWTQQNLSGAPAAAGVSQGVRLRGLVSGQNLQIRQAIELPGTPTQPTGNPGVFKVDTVWTLSWWANINTGNAADWSNGITWRNSNTLTSGNGLVSVSAAAPLTGIETIVPDDGSGYARYARTVRISAAPAATSTCLCVAISMSQTGLGDIFITGIQLEPGPVATPFEHRPYGTELALCQRYYQLVSARGIVATVTSTAGNGIAWLPGVTMRADPSTNVSTVRFVKWWAASNNNANVVTVDSGAQGVMLRFTPIKTDATQDFRVISGFDSDTSKDLGLDAEL